MFAASGVAADLRWQTQYFYDVAKETFVISDIGFSSAKRGMAVGYIAGRHNPRPMSVVTTDGGEHWTQVPLHEIPISLFILNDSAIWMVTENGVWFTSEGGRDWKKLYKTKLVGRVWFVDDHHGYGIGVKKTVLETKDGGTHWTAVEAAATPPTSSTNTVYTTVDFWTPKDGVIIGRSRPPRSGFEASPLWMDPHPQWRKEYPATTIFLQTVDAGNTWKPSATSLFGTITQMAVNPNGNGLALLEYERFFSYPSEVLRMDNHSRYQFRTTYKNANRFITDVAMTPDGTGYAAGIEAMGFIVGSPVPSKVKVLQSQDLEKWTEMPVDYRATATRVHLAQSGSEVWLATDTGMILKLQRVPETAPASAGSQ